MIGRTEQMDLGYALTLVILFVVFFGGFAQVTDVPAWVDSHLCPQRALERLHEQGNTQRLVTGAEPTHDLVAQCAHAVGGRWRLLTLRTSGVP